MMIPGMMGKKDKMGKGKRMRLRNAFPRERDLLRQMCANIGRGSRNRIKGMGQKLGVLGCMQRNEGIKCVREFSRDSR